MKSFIISSLLLVLMMTGIYLCANYCEETVFSVSAAIDEIEKAPVFQPEKAEELYEDFSRSAEALRYFTVASYVDDVQIPLSALRYAPADDRDAQETLIKEARLKLEKLRVAGTFSLATIV